jgi:hypothetical protein
MAVMDEAADWARGLDELVERIAPRFCRIEPRRRVRAYLQGLLAPIERQNGWQLAENAGDRTPEGVQDFLARMRWDADQVRDDPGLRRGRSARLCCESGASASSRSALDRSGCLWGPAPGQQFVETAVGPVIDEFGQNVGDVRFGVDAVQFARLDQ